MALSMRSMIGDVEICILIVYSHLFFSLNSFIFQLFLPLAVWLVTGYILYLVILHVSNNTLFLPCDSSVLTVNFPRNMASSPLGYAMQVL